MSAYKVVFSSADVGPSTFNSNFKFVTKLRNIIYCSDITVVRPCILLKNMSTAFINACTYSNSIHHIGEGAEAGSLASE
jgi:predicted deacetylase